MSPPPVPKGIYPAIWCVAIGGFAVAPFALFNATWALRQVIDAAHPTWDNASDGKASPGLRPKLCPTNGWELVLHFQDAKIVCVQPFQGSSFGPVVFAVESPYGLEVGAEPKITVSAI